MEVNVEQLICGIRPADLKSLLRTGDRFDTPTAMKYWRLEEPEITSVLAAMQQEGWIEFHGNKRGVDWWEKAQRGRRLVATRLLKRISTEQGRAVLAQLIQEARIVNAETEGSRRITQILLFGSLLRGTADNTIGDIDVVIHHQRRELPEEKWRALEKREKADVPASVRASFEGLLSWPETRLTRRLAKLSPYLSLHQEHDLVGNSYSEVYAYDLNREQEIQTDPAPRVRKAEREEALPNELVNENLPYSRTPRDWPTVGPRVAIPDFDDEQMRLAQHLWMNGNSTKEIAVSVRAQPRIVEAYLASRRLRVTKPDRVRIFAGLKATMLAVLPTQRDYSVQVDLKRWRGAMTLETMLFRAGRCVARYWRVGRRGRIRDAQVNLVETLQNIDQVAWDWYETMRSKWRGLNVEILTQCAESDAGCTDEGARRIDLRPLEKPLLELLDRCWKAPRKRYDGYEQRLAVQLQADPIVSYWRQRNGEPKRLAGPSALEVVNLARTIYKDSETALQATHFSAGVTGETLESPEPE